jgi:hypothetical protein
MTGAPPEAQKTMQGVIVLIAMLLVTWRLRSRVRVVR